MKRELKARAGEWEIKPEGPPGSSRELGIVIWAAWNGDGTSTSARWRESSSKWGPQGAALSMNRLSRILFGSLAMTLDSCPSTQRSEWGVRHENLELWGPNVTLPTGKSHVEKLMEHRPWSEGACGGRAGVGADAQQPRSGLCGVRGH